MYEHTKQFFEEMVNRQIREDYERLVNEWAESIEEEKFNLCLNSPDGYNVGTILQCNHEDVQKEVEQAVELTFDCTIENMTNIIVNSFYDNPKKYQIIHVLTSLGDEYELFLSKAKLI